MSTSSSTEGGSDPNLLLWGAQGGVVSVVNGYRQINA